MLCIKDVLKIFSLNHMNTFRYRCLYKGGFLASSDDAYSNSKYILDSVCEEDPERINDFYVGENLVCSLIIIRILFIYFFYLF